MITLLLALLACSKEETPAAEPAKEPAAAAAADIPAPADVAAPPADATKTASGVAYKVLTAGTGTVHPAAGDRAEAIYTGWTTDGKMVETSTKRKKPAKFALKSRMPGLAEGIQLMVVGEKARFWIPEEQAHNGKQGRPAGMLVYDVELVSIEEAPKPIPAPEDVAAAPADATKTKSGLAYKVLQKGTGSEHPGATARVSVEYTGWSKTGEMFDSSVTRGKPASFALNQVIAGWTEGVQLMVVGEKARFWIPSDLAYGDTPKKPGAPSGDLTFDIELKDILPAAAPGEGRPGGMGEGGRKGPNAVGPNAGGEGRPKPIMKPKAQ